MTEIFKNAGEPWTVQEDQQLNKLYNEEQLDIIAISKIHNRAPGGILSRLQKNKHVPNRYSARGYIAYTNSDLYKEIVAKNKEKRENKFNLDLEDNKKPTSTVNKMVLSKADNILISIKQSDYIQLQNDVNEMKNDIKSLKNNISELVEMMKAVYEFEDS